MDDQLFILFKSFGILNKNSPKMHHGRNQSDECECSNANSAILVSTMKTKTVVSFVRKFKFTLVCLQ